jgi:hypothetical protein
MSIIVNDDLRAKPSEDESLDLHELLKNNLKKKKYHTESKIKP